MTGWRKRTVMEMAREAGADYDDGVWLLMPDELEAFAKLVREDEREECAKVCEEGGKDASGRIHVQAWGCAKAIRERNNHD